MATSAVTLARNRISPLSNVEAGVTESTVRYYIPYTDIAYGTTATDVVTVALGATPANWMVTSARAYVPTAFAGSGGLAITVGTTSSTAAFITSQSVLTVAELGGASTLATLANATGTSSLTLQATFTNSVSGSPSALTAGECYIFLDVIDLKNQGQ